MIKEIKRALFWLFLALSCTLVAMDQPPAWKDVQKTLDQEEDWQNLSVFDFIRDILDDGDSQSLQNKDKENRPIQPRVKVHCNLTYPKRDPRGQKDPIRLDVETRKKAHFKEQLQSQLIAACIAGDYDAVNNFINAGAKLDSIAQHGAPLFATLIGLHKARITKTGQHVRIITLLMAKGADIKIQDPRGNSLLHYAVIANNPALFSFFLEKCPQLLMHRNDADLLPNQVVEGEDTMLMQAILATHYKK